MNKLERRVRKAAMELLRAEAALNKTKLSPLADRWWGDLAESAHELVESLAAADVRKSRAKPKKSLL